MAIGGDVASGGPVPLTAFRTHVTCVHQRLTAVAEPKTKTPRRGFDGGILTLLQPLQSQVSKLMFVDSPGAERLAMDPEVLRLREGVQLNR